jgi:hypothetical protein
MERGERSSAAKKVAILSTSRLSLNFAWHMLLRKVEMFLSPCERVHFLR